MSVRILTRKTGCAILFFTISGAMLRISWIQVHRKLEYGEVSPKVKSSFLFNMTMTSLELAVRYQLRNCEKPPVTTGKIIDLIRN